MMTRTITLIFSLLPLSTLFAQSYASQVKTLDAYIENARQQWDVPGLAVAVVKDGQVLLSKGYGHREMDSQRPVDQHTIFACASTTKAMTAAAMGLLIDEGKADWDDPVAKHMPEFLLSDPYITRDLRVRDLFTHNAGLGNADFLWYGSDLKRQEILARMQYAPIAYPLRGGYTYQNIMYLAAGRLIEKLSGKSWEEFVKERLFSPLGMDRTFPNKAYSKAYTNRSIPHHYIDEKIHSIADSEADAIAPAGAAWSCVEDMARWMNFILDSTKVDGQPLLKPETYREWLKPQIIIPQEQFYPTVRLTKPHWTTYALGWFQHDYQGRAVSFHTGSLAGTVAICGLIPDEHLGVYVFGNLDHAEVRHAIMYKVFDLFDGDPDGRDWSTEFKGLYDGLKKESDQDREKMIAGRVQGTQPSHRLANYAGNYTDPFYGEAVVEVNEGALRVSLSSNTSLDLEHWHFDTFLGHWNVRWMTPTPVNFELGPDGKIQKMKVGRYSYTKAAGKN